MNDIASPTALAETLTELFPEFATELEGEQVASYHQVVQRLATVIAGYLQEASQRTVERFCEVVNAMVATNVDA
jgi:hypothetical protein